MSENSEGGKGLILAVFVCLLACLFLAESTSHEFYFDHITLEVPLRHSQQQHNAYIKGPK